MLNVAKADGGQDHLAGAFEKNLAWSVDHDVGDGIVVEQCLQRSQPQHVIDQFIRQFLLFAQIELDALFGGDIGDQSLDLDAELFGAQGGDGGGIEAPHTEAAQFGDRMGWSGGAG